MKCPRCNSKVEHTRSGVDDHTIAYCVSPKCDWQEVIGAAERAHSGSFHSFNTSTVCAGYERHYNGQ